MIDLDSSFQNQLVLIELVRVSNYGEHSMKHSYCVSFFVSSNYYVHDLLNLFFKCNVMKHYGSVHKH